MLGHINRLLITVIKGFKEKKNHKQYKVDNFFLQKWASIFIKKWGGYYKFIRKCSITSSQEQTHFQWINRITWNLLYQNIFVADSIK